MAHVWFTVYRDLPQLRGLEAAADDEEFLTRWAAVKLQAKRRAATYLKERTGVTVDPNVMFDVQARCSPSPPVSHSCPHLQIALARSAVPPAHESHARMAPAVPRPTEVPLGKQ